MSKPNDALMAFMRAQGLHMQSRWCHNGTLVPRSIADAKIDLLWNPLFMVDTEQEALEGLVNATALAAPQHAAQVSAPGGNTECTQAIAAVSIRLDQLKLRRCMFAARFAAAAHTALCHHARPRRSRCATAACVARRFSLWWSQLPVPGVMLFGAGLAVQLPAPLALCGALNATTPPMVNLTGRATPLFNLTAPAAQLFVGLVVSAMFEAPCLWQSHIHARLGTEGHRKVAPECINC